MKGSGYFQNLRFFLRNCLETFWVFGNFLGGIFGGIFWRNFLGEIFWEDFFGRIFLGGFFWEDFLGGFFWEEFFGRNYLVEINKELMFLSRFWGNFVSMHKEEGRRKKF